VFKKYSNILSGVKRAFRVLQEFEFPPTFLGYLMGHRWGATTMLT
jgi:hypothetical protein